MKIIKKSLLILLSICLILIFTSCNGKNAYNIPKDSKSKIEGHIIYSNSDDDFKKISMELDNDKNEEIVNILNKIPEGDLNYEINGGNELELASDILLIINSDEEKYEVSFYNKEDFIRIDTIKDGELTNASYYYITSIEDDLIKFFDSIDPDISKFMFE